MMRKRVYRTESQIMMTILHTCQPCSNITRIVYENNLNFDLAKRYLKKMIEKGYIVKEIDDRNRTWYRTTNLGVDMTVKLIEVIQIIEEIKS